VIDVGAQCADNPTIQRQMLSHIITSHILHPEALWKGRY
jgi:hypothetical protein